MIQASTDSRSAREAEKASRLLLPTVLLAALVVPTSISGTAVALNAIATSLGGGEAGLQWAVNAFNLSFACSTLVWGSLADRLGRGRFFTVGALIFAIGSVMSGLAPSLTALDVARAIAGVGGGAIVSCGSALLAERLAGDERLKAFAYFGTTAGVGVALGPTVAGVLVGSLGWRSVFLIQACMLVAVGAGAVLLRLYRRGERAASQRFDVTGCVLFVAGAIALMFAIVQVSEWGIGSFSTGLAFATAVVLLAILVYVELHVRHPFLDFRLFRNRKFVAMCLVPVAASFSFVVVLTYFPTYLQKVPLFSTALSGVALTALAAPVVVAPVIAARLVRTGVSANIIIFFSLFFMVAGVALLLTSGPSTTLWSTAVPLLVVGVGMGLSAGLVDGHALTSVAETEAGTAAGVLNTMRLGSEAIAVAVYATLITFLSDGSVSQVSVERYDSAFHATATIALVIAAGVSVAIVFLAISHKRAEEDGMA